MTNKEFSNFYKKIIYSDFKNVSDNFDNMYKKISKISFLADGGFGTIFLCKMKNGFEIVAKTQFVSNRIGDYDRNCNYPINESKLMLKFNKSENIVSSLAYGEAKCDDGFYSIIFMNKYMTVSEYFSIERPISDYVKFFEDILKAIKFIQENGSYIHRDGKPDNYFVDMNRTFMIGDLGVCTNKRNGTHIDNNCTSTEKLKNGDVDFSTDLNMLANSIKILDTYSVVSSNEIFRKFVYKISEKCNEFTSGSRALYEFEKIKLKILNESTNNELEDIKNLITSNNLANIEKAALILENKNSEIEQRLYIFAISRIYKRRNNTHKNSRYYKKYIAPNLKSRSSKDLFLSSFLCLNLCSLDEKRKNKAILDLKESADEGCAMASYYYGKYCFNRAHKNFRDAYKYLKYAYDHGIIIAYDEIVKLSAMVNNSNDILYFIDTWLREDIVEFILNIHKVASDKKEINYILDEISI